MSLLAPKHKQTKSGFVGLAAFTSTVNVDLMINSPALAQHHLSQGSLLLSVFMIHVFLRW